MRHIMTVAIAAPGTPAVRVVVCHRGNRNCWRQMGMGAIYGSSPAVKVVPGGLYRYPTAAATTVVPTTTLSESLGAMIYRRVGCVSSSITVRVEFTAAQGA